jgi:RES domain
MPLIIERLLEIPTEPRRLEVFRAIALAIDGTPAEDFVPDPGYATPDSGRWASSAGTLYTSLSPEVTWNEYCRWRAKDLRCPAGASRGIPKKMLNKIAYEQIGPPPPARALVRLEFDLQRVPDLTLRHVGQTLLSASFDIARIRSDEHSECRKLSAVARLLGWDAMIVPSAATDQPGRCVPVFQAGRARLIDRSVVASPAGPTVFHAFETRYRQGERPKWLKLR